MNSRLLSVCGTACWQALLADREKIYVCTGLSPFRPDVHWDAGKEDPSVEEICSTWRNACLEASHNLCAAAHQEHLREDVFRHGGFQVLLAVALHTGSMLPGDVSTTSLHSALKELLSYEDAARRILDADCVGQARAAPANQDACASGAPLLHAACSPPLPGPALTPARKSWYAGSRSPAVARPIPLCPGGVHGLAIGGRAAGARRDPGVVRPAAPGEGAAGA